MPAHLKYSSSEYNPVLSEKRIGLDSLSKSMAPAPAVDIELLLSKTKMWVDFACESSSVVGSRRISPDFSSTMQVTDPRIEFKGIPASKSAKTVALNAVDKI